MAKNPMGRALFELMARKRTNLSVAVDVDTVEEMLDIADKVGPHVCVLKTHVDVFDSWSPSIAERLSALAAKHGAHDFALFFGGFVTCQAGGIPWSLRA